MRLVVLLLVLTSLALCADDINPCQIKCLKYRRSKRLVCMKKCVAEIPKKIPKKTKLEAVVSIIPKNHYYQSSDNIICELGCNLLPRLIQKVQCMRNCPVHFLGDNKRIPRHFSDCPPFSKDWVVSHPISSWSDNSKKDICLTGCSLLKKDWQKSLCEIGCNQIKYDTEIPAADTQGAKKDICLTGCSLLKKDWQKSLCEIGCNQIKYDTEVPLADKSDSLSEADFWKKISEERKKKPVKKNKGVKKELIYHILRMWLKKKTGKDHQVTESDISFFERIWKNNKKKPQIRDLDGELKRWFREKVGNTPQLTESDFFKKEHHEKFKQKKPQAKKHQAKKTGRNSLSSDTEKKTNLDSLIKMLKKRFLNAKNTGKELMYFGKSQLAAELRKIGINWSFSDKALSPKAGVCLKTCSKILNHIERMNCNQRCLGHH